VTLATLVAAVRAGDRRALARAISVIEDEHPEAAALVAALHTPASHAYIVGITGPPGAGKSTLVDALVRHVRGLGHTLGVLAVDPSSPFTGGALLGDRVRMQRHAGDTGVYIRSMATRGHLGGLARATSDAALVLDAAGHDVVIIETVGVGQDEVDVVRAADVSLVVVAPGAGDEVQALKAGVMEIADIHVVNKADQPGADRTVASIEASLGLHAYAPGEWRPPVLRTDATTGTGVEALWAEVERFRVHAAETGHARQRVRADFRLREILGQRFLRHVEETTGGAGAFGALVDAVAARHTDPYSAADALLRQVLPGPGPVDHVAVAVADPEAATAFFRDVLGLALSGAEDVGSQGVRVWCLGGGGSRIELIAPLTPESPVGRFLDKRGPGLHHVALAVDALDALLDSLAARGVRLIDRVARPGAGGSRIAFVHPASTGGVLVELKER
jgi:LAO/AO transport system kinase